MNPIKVMTYNIRGAWGMDDVRDIRRIADVIREQNADIACLQEVHLRIAWSGFADQPRQLQTALQMHDAYQGNERYVTGTLGNLILSRFPIKQVKKLPLGGERYHRGVLAAQIQIEDHRTIWVACTHWDLTENSRLDAAQKTATFLSQLESPALLLGDFNEQPPYPAVQKFLQLTHFRDLAPHNAPTFPADTPQNRIDLILGTSEWNVADYQVIPTLASDHLPVTATLTLDH